MSGGKVINDATESSKGTIYQLCVAVLKCYEMQPGQKVLIESEGDVTIPGSQQVETKQYSDSLTDSHPNLWNTLNNWMQNDFEPSSYSSLILFTTQPFGERASIKLWNEFSVKQKLDALCDILLKSEEREKERIEKPKLTGSRIKTPDILLQQRFVLDLSRRQKLEIVLQRFYIEASSPTLPDLHQKIKNTFIRGILEGKKDDFLNTLLGYITQPSAAKNSKWEVTYESFERKISDLTNLFYKETREFPRKYYYDSNMPQNSVLSDHDKHNFVVKINEIKHYDAIPEAIRDYLSTIKTIQLEFKNYEVPPGRTKKYADELLSIFKKKHRVACNKCSEIIRDSQIFFDEFTADEPREFEGFSRPPLGFKNGLLHIQLDDSSIPLCWKLNL